MNTGEPFPDVKKPGFGALLVTKVGGGFVVVTQTRIRPAGSNCWPIAK